jgi:hypothetical protein
MLALLRVLRVSAAGSWIGAVTYVFSGVGVGLVFFPNLHPGMALLPWVVWAVARPTQTLSGRVVPLSSLLACDMLGGDVFTICMALAAATLWVLMGEPASSRWRSLAALASAAVLATLAALPLVLAAILWSAETNRAVLGLKLGQSFFYSIPPLRLLEFLVPYPFGSTWSLSDADVWGFSVFRGKTAGMIPSLYAGALAPIALVLLWRDRSVAARFGRWVLAAALLLAVLPSLLPAALAGWPSPLPLRNPEKLAVLAAFAVALLSGLAVDRLAVPRPSRRWLVAVAAGFALAAVAAAWRPEAAGALAVRVTGAAPALAGRAASHLSAALAEGGVAWCATLVALWLLPSGRSRLARTAGLTLLTLVPMIVTLRIARTFSEDQVLAPTAFVRRIARLDPAGEYRVLGESLFEPASALEGAHAQADVASIELVRRCWYYHTQAFWGRGTVLNYDFDVGDLSRVESLRRVARQAAGFRDSADFFGALALRWGMRFRDQPALAGFRRFGGDTLQDWDENASALPDIRLARLWRESPGPREALAAIATLSHGEIVLETGRSAAGSARPGSVRVLERSPERLILALSVPDPAWLFVLRGYWSQRSVLLDGRPAEYVPANLAFSAMEIPAGEHRVEWTEQVPGGSASIAGPGLFLLAAAWIGIRERRAKPS